MQTEVAVINQDTISSNIGLEESYFLTVGQETTISQYDQNKIKDPNTGYEGEELARYHIGNALVTFYKMVGIPNERMPDKDLNKQIAKYIQKTYHYLVPTEIITSLEFALQGKYVVNLEHHGTMDLIYVDQFLSAYSKYRYDKKFLLQQKMEQQSVFDKVAANMIKSDKAVKDGIIASYFNYQKGCDNDYDVLLPNWFEWMVDIGLIPYDREWLTNKYKDLKHEKHDWTPLQREGYTKLLFIQKCFAEMIEAKVEKPFDLFAHVSYLDVMTYRQHAVGLAKELSTKLTHK